VMSCRCMGVIMERLRISNHTIAFVHCKIGV
jgi:hypothetical protein